MQRTESRYLHGTEPREQERLSRLNDLLNDAAVMTIGLSGGERILDFGCGLGQLTRALARAAGPGGVTVGFDRSADQLAQARQLARSEGEDPLVDLRQGDVLEPPLHEDEWGTFDLVHARFVLEHLRDPLAAVRVMVRAVRPGGRIVLQDDDHDVLRAWPEPPGLDAIWRAYINTYERHGNDPYIGRRLVSLMHEAGAQPRRNDWLFFGGCSGSPDFPSFVENLARILEGAREAILATGRVDRRPFETGLAAFRAWGDRPDAALWFAVAWAEAEKPRAGITSDLPRV